MDKVFLTDRRREVLAGEADNIQDDSLTVAKSRIRTRSRMALEELIEVAESEEIDNTDVFDPNDVFHLLRAILTPTEDQLDDDAQGLITAADANEEFQQYADRIHVQLDKFLRFRHSIDDSE